MSTRRTFLGALAATPFALGIDPIQRPSDKPALKLSLAAYSFRQKLDLAKKPTMTLFEFIDLAADLPLDAVELTSYFWAEQTPEYAKKLAAHAAKKKLAVSGVPVGNKFTLKDELLRKKEVDKAIDWIKLAGEVGAKTVRIFAGDLEKGETLEDAQKRVVASIEACLPAAEKAGVLLALENHGGITATPDQLLALVKPIKSQWLGVNIDTGNFKTDDPYSDVAKIAPYGVVCQVKTEVNPGGKKKEEADLGKMVKILKDANFHGYVVLEYEAAEEAGLAVPKHVKELRKLIG
jgi:sugar phosphate isomerase/epimerase